MLLQDLWTGNTALPCFTTGTLITTLRGEKAVEELAQGDRVITRDNGLQTVRRIVRRDFDYGQLSVVPHLQPVLVTTGALGKGLPERDMLVSPSLRLLVSGDRLPIGPNSATGADEALVAARVLSDMRTIRPCQVLGVSYVHVVLDRHEVLLANGLWAECFQSGDPSLGAVGNGQRTELAELFPNFDGASVSAHVGHSGARQPDARPLA